MLQRKVPDGEGFKLRISGFDTTLAFGIKLTEADSHLATAWTWSCHDDQRTCRLDIVIAAKALVGVYQLNVIGIALDVVMVISADAKMLQAMAIDGSAALSVVVRDDNAVYHEASLLELAAQTEHIFIIGDAQVLTNFVLFDVERADNDNYLGA